MLDVTALQILAALQNSKHAPTSAGNLRVVLRDSEFDALIARGPDARLVLGVRQPASSVEGDLSTDFASLTFSNAITLHEGATEGPFMLLSLTADTSELESYVAAVFEGLLDYASAEWIALVHAAAAAVESYQLKRQSPGNLDEQVGLFGELLIIACSSDLDVAVAAWHENRFAVHDFSIGQARLEVKSSVSPLRAHWVSQAQVMPIGAEAVTFASLYVPPTAGGQTVRQIADEIEGRATSSARRTFRRKIEDLIPTSELFEFDRTTAAGSLSLVAANRIPRPSVEDARITAVKWRVDLSGLAGGSDAELEPWLSLLEFPAGAAG